MENSLLILNKKEYEVRKMAKLISDLSKENNLDFVFDVGCGRGYLSKLLIYNYSIDVVGVDNNKDLREKINKKTHNFEKKEKGKCIAVTEHLSLNINFDDIINKMRLKNNFMMISLHSWYFFEI